MTYKYSHLIDTKVQVLNLECMQEMLLLLLLVSKGSNPNPGLLDYKGMQALLLHDKKLAFI